MIRTAALIAVFAMASPALGQEGYEIPDEIAATAQALGEAGLQSDLAYEITRDLTTQIGPRLAGTPQEARALEWGAALFEELGFENVRIEPFELDLWTRGRSIYEEVAIVSPFPQPIYATSLGGAAATPEEGLEAEVVFFDSYDDLIAFDGAEDSLAGKLAFVNDRMVRSMTGEGYGWANRKRRLAWVAAEDRGALGVLVRSVGTSTNRFAHTGMMGFPEDRMPNIPALAVSAPDADQIERIAESGETMTIRLKTYAGWRGEVMSGNVIAEIPGREIPDEIVVIGGHIDSWDLATGALDDGAGVGITVAAAKLISELPQNPRRTIRVIMFGAEEVGLVGARAYARARAADGTVNDHVIGSESDFGADRVWRFSSNVGPDALSAMEAMQREMAHLGIIRGGNSSGGGPDMIPLQMMGVPMARLDQIGTDYFDYHHTPNDTFDKIDPDAMAQNVAAWAMFVYMAAELDVDFRAGRQTAEASE
ncbi:MAG: M20/M25/M40 family metallo-hydrolase [Pseudomonadota bacterium]